MAASLQTEEACKVEVRIKLLTELLDSGYPTKASLEVLTELFPFPTNESEALATGVAWGSNLPPFGKSINPNFPRQVRFKGKFREYDLDKMMASLHATKNFYDAKDITYGKQVDMDLHLHKLIKLFLSKIGVGTSKINWNMITSELHPSFLAGVIEACSLKIYGLEIAEEGHRKHIVVGNNGLVIVAPSGIVAESITNGIHGSELCSEHMATNRAIRDSQNKPSGISIKQENHSYIFKALKYIIHGNAIAECFSENFKNDHQNTKFDKIGRIGRTYLQAWIDLQLRNKVKITPQMLCNVSQTIIGRPISRITAWKILKKNGLIKSKQIIMK
jgi:hypothetical protein